MPGVELRRSYVFDGDLECKDAGLIATSAAAQVGGSNKIIDVGVAAMLAVLVVDISAIEIASNDERYDIIVQGSSSSSFASTIVELGSMEFGAKEVLDGDQDSTPGRFEIPFINVQDDVVWQYIRVFTKIAGAIATGINYKAFIGVPS